MFLRWLLNNYVGQAAQAKLRDSVLESVRDSFRGAASGGERREGGNPSAAEELAPPCDVAFIFALGIESGGLLDLLQQSTATRLPTHQEHAGGFQGKEAVVVESGVGAAAAAQATADVIKFHQPAWVVSAGFAGGLADDLRKGQILMADMVADTSGKELAVGLKMDPQIVATTPGLHVGRLVTVDKLIRTQAEKRRLAAASRALACDMESFAVAQTCARLNTRFLSIRIISDAVDDELPKEIGKLLAQKTWAGKLGAAAQAVFSRPSSAADLLKLQDDALKYSDRLARFLAGVVGQLPAPK